MKNKLLDVSGKFKIKNVSEYIKKNLLMVLLALFVCVGVSLSAYFRSDVADLQDSWEVAITHASSTPIPTLVPDTGWWSAIATPTPK